jgi:hypothetical protein
VVLVLQVGQAALLVQVGWPQGLSQGLYPWQSQGLDEVQLQWVLTLVLLLPVQSLLVRWVARLVQVVLQHLRVHVLLAQPVLALVKPTAWSGGHEPSLELWAHLVVLQFWLGLVRLDLLEELQPFA